MRYSLKDGWVPSNSSYHKFQHGKEKSNESKKQEFINSNKHQEILEEIDEFEEKFPVLGKLKQKFK